MYLFPLSMETFFFKRFTVRSISCSRLTFIVISSQVSQEIVIGRTFQETTKWSISKNIQMNTFQLEIVKNSFNIRDVVIVKQDFHFGADYLCQWFGILVLLKLLLTSVSTIHLHLVVFSTIPSNLLNDIIFCSFILFFYIYRTWARWLWRVTRDDGK